MALIAIGIDPFESLEAIESFRESRGYTWTAAKADPDFFADYRILIRATKVAVDTDWVIIWRERYGTTSAERWRQVFQELVE